LLNFSALLFISRTVQLSTVVSEAILYSFKLLSLSLNVSPIGSGLSQCETLNLFTYLQAHEHSSQSSNIRNTSPTVGLVVQCCSLLHCLQL